MNISGALHAKNKKNDPTDFDREYPVHRITSLDTPTGCGDLLATPQDNQFDTRLKHCLNVQCIGSATDSIGVEVEDGERSMVGCICAGGTLAGGDLGGDCCVLAGCEDGAGCTVACSSGTGAAD